MSNVPLICMAGLNLMAAAGYLVERNYGMMIVFVSYTVACVGFIVAK
jgi:hypothetical protein